MMNIILTESDYTKLSGLKDFCTKSTGLLQFIGYVLMIFKIFIPIIIIIYGILDFGKAVMGTKDDEIKRSAKTLLFRALSGVMIFFIPSFVLWFFGLINGYKQDSEASDFEVCQTCILYPTKCNTTSSATGE